MTPERQSPQWVAGSFLSRAQTGAPPFRSDRKASRRRAERSGRGLCRTCCAALGPERAGLCLSTGFYKFHGAGWTSTDRRAAHRAQVSPTRIVLSRFLHVSNLSRAAAGRRVHVCQACLTRQTPLRKRSILKLLAYLALFSPEKNERACF